MVLEINLYRAAIGLYNNRSNRCCSHGLRKHKTSSVSILFVINFTIVFLLAITNLNVSILTLYIVIYHSVSINFIIVKDLIKILFFYRFLIKQLLIICGDVHVNPGPKNKDNLSVAHWNLNSVSVHDFEKLRSLQAFNSVYQFDIICLSETFLDSSFSSDDIDLSIEGYNIIRADHPVNIKRGGVCVYYRETLPLKVLNIYQLTECLVLEIVCENKKCILACLYRSPSQSSDEFDTFLIKFEDMIELIFDFDPNIVLILGDFNAKLSSWKIDDNDTLEGISINDITSSYGLTQIISDPTHILPNSSSCIDLIFCNQTNMITNYGVLPSLHTNCHHQIIFANLNFNISIPPPYERHIWHYNKADIVSIRRALELFDWNQTFQNIDVNKQVEIFNSTILNIFKNYVPNEKIIVNEKDPPWITQTIKYRISQIHKLYDSFIYNGKRNADYESVIVATNNLNQLINNSKSEYYNRLSSKLSNTNTSPKAYWTILKSIFSNKKIPKIPPLFVNNNVISNFQDKATLFNSHFAKQCSILNNNSNLPEQINTSIFSLSSVNLKDDKLLSLIRSLDASKSHGHDNISIRMIKICDVSIVKPLMIIFRNCLKEGIFPSCWKKANITPIHKKGDKCDISNYRPISVLPISGKLFEKLIYSDLYNYLSSNDILDTNQSGFRSGDSCTNQLISITHEIFKAFDSNPTLEVRGVFLDISKAFDRVWHEGLVWKLKSCGIQGEVLKILQSFLNNRLQRVILNGQSSNWEKVNAGVPQGSILGPLLFLIYINDISSNLESEVKLFADDTCLFSIVNDPTLSANALNSDLSKIENWAYQWKMSFNPDLSKQAQEVIFSRKRLEVNHPPLYFNGSPVQKTNVQKHLGVYLDDKLCFKHHLKNLLDKSTKSIAVLRKLRYYVPRKSLITVYKSFIRSCLDYGDVIYDQPKVASFSDRIESIQYNAALAITGCIRGTSKEKLYQELGLEYLSSRRWYRRLCSFYKIVNMKYPSYLYNLVPQPHHVLNTRNQSLIPNMFCRTEVFSNSFFPSCIKEWKKLDRGIQQSVSYNQFKISILKLIRPTQNSIFDICDNEGIKLLTRLRLGLSHLNSHKFNHGFLDTVNPMCSCNTEEETVAHFFLRCPNFTQHRIHLMNEIDKIHPNILTTNDNVSLKILLYGDEKSSDDINSNIIRLTIEFINSSKRFEIQLF